MRASLTAAEGDAQTARDLAVRAVDEASASGDEPATAFTFTCLGEISLSPGEPAEARRRFEDALTIRRRLGDNVNIAALLENLAMVALFEDRPEHALLVAHESLRLAREIDDRIGISYALDAAASALARGGDPARGVRLWAAAAAIRDSVRATMLPAETAIHGRAMEDARAFLDEHLFSELRDSGRAMTIEEACAYAADAPAVRSARWRSSPLPALGARPIRAACVHLTALLILLP
jgi:hypothetical protein